MRDLNLLLLLKLNKTMAKFTKGIYTNKPSEKTPDFVKASIDIKADTFMQWIEENPEVVTEKGYIKLQITESSKDIANKEGEVFINKGDWQITINDFFYKDSGSDDKIDTNDLPFN